MGRTLKTLWGFTNLFLGIGVLTLGLVQLSEADGAPNPIDQFNLTGTLNGTPVVILNPNYADAFLTVPQYIRKYNYPCQVHYVTTPDNYILGLHRVPYGVKSPPTNRSRPVAYLQHGLISSSSSWTINGPDSSLAFQLADQGYDVWLGNFRGNVYSRNHTTLNPNETSGAFWNFTFHENGKYDIPTTSLFVALSLDPTLNAKIKLFVALAPVVYLTYTMTPLRIIAPLILGGVTQEVLTTYGPGEFQANNAAMAQFKSWTCISPPVADLVCGSLYFLFMGFDFDQFNKTQIPVYNSNYPQGSSLKTFIHYAQFINQQKFCQYDYGVLNLVNYGSLSPPCYDLTQTKVPTALYYGQNDWLADPTDVQILIDSKILPNVILTKKIELTAWNHADFIWAIDVNTLLYNDMITLVNQYK